MEVKNHVSSIGNPQSIRTNFCHPFTFIFFDFFKEFFNVNDNAISKAEIGDCQKVEKDTFASIREDLT